MQSRERVVEHRDVGAVVSARRADGSGRRWMLWMVAGVAGAAVLPTATLHSCGAARVETEFPPGLEVREALHAAWPQPGADGDDRPEVLVLEKGEADGLCWAHGRAYLHAPIEVVARALQNPDVTVSRRSVDEWTTETGVEPDYPVSYRTKNVVHALITVDYQVTWRQGAREQDGVVTEYVANYQKTEGTQYISVMRGWIRAERLSDEVTALEFVSELQAMRTGPDDVASYVSDLFGSIEAFVHDRPLPDWQDG